MEKLQPLLLFSLLVPCITAVVMIYASGDKAMIQDFWTRLLLFKVQLSYATFSVLLMPCVILVATPISLFFGYSIDQFSLADGFSVMKGWGVLGVLIPLLLAPAVEEIGWRGYGVDSLRVHFNLFNTSLIFGALWALWHLPLFSLRATTTINSGRWVSSMSPIFFVSVIVVAFLMNWVYYQTDRGIPAVILFHSILNLSSMLLKTEPFTKCIATGLLCVVLVVVVAQNSEAFFQIGMKPPA